MEPTNTTPTPTEQPAAAATVTAPKPAAKGVIPQHVKGWIFLGIAAVIVLGMFFSGGTSGKHVTAHSVSSGTPLDDQKPVVSGLTPDQVQQRVQAMDHDRRDDINTARVGDGNPTLTADPNLNPDAAILRASKTPQPPVQDPISDDEKKRAYASRYASNIALSYRNPNPNGTSQSQLPTQVLGINDSAQDYASSAMRNPQGLVDPQDIKKQIDALRDQQAQLLASQQRLAALSGVGQQQPLPSPTAQLRQSSLNSSNGPMHTLFEGTVLETVLVNRLNGDFSGPVICQVTYDIYSHDHTKVLIPAGSKVLGETKQVTAFGQGRLAVMFHRLIMPDGYSVDLDKAAGLNQIGETALKDKVNNHYLEIFGVSIAIGVVQGFAALETNTNSITGLPASPSDAYKEGVASSLSQSSMQVLNKFLNILPTITIREGTRVRVYLTADLQVPAYADHTMPVHL